MTSHVNQLKLKNLPSSLDRERQPEPDTTTNDSSPNARDNSTTAVPRPRSLSLQLGATPVSTPPPTPAKQIQLPKANSLAGVYVKLKTTDHSGLSTNTILHINNSQPANKSVISNGCPPEAAPLTFCGDNVIVGAGSLLVRRNKQLRIHFEIGRASCRERV